MTKNAQRPVIIFLTCVIAIFAYLGWREATQFPANIANGITQVCKMPFFSLGTRTKSFFGDTIDAGTAKLTFTGGAAGSETVFTVDSKGNYQSSAERDGAVVIEEGTIPRPDAQRIFNYLGRVDLLSTRFKKGATPDNAGEIVLQAGTSKRTIPDIGANLCDVTDAAMEQVAKIYIENPQRRM